MRINPFKRCFFLNQKKIVFQKFRPPKMAKICYATNMTKKKTWELWVSSRKKNSTLCDKKSLRYLSMLNYTCWKRHLIILPLPSKKQRRGKILNFFFEFVFFRHNIKAGASLGQVGELRWLSWQFPANFCYN